MPAPYERLAPHYHRLCVIPARYELRKVWRFYAGALGKLKGSEFIDVGSGTGLSGRMLKRWCRCGDSLEPSPHMRNVMPKALYRRCDRTAVETASAPRRKVDVVAAVFDVFNYLEPGHLDLALRATRRLLRPQGVFIFDVLTRLTPKDPSHSPRPQSPDSRAAVEIHVGEDVEVHILYSQSRAQWEKALRKSGFRLLLVRHINVCTVAAQYLKCAFVAQAI